MAHSGKRLLTLLCIAVAWLTCSATPADQSAMEYFEPMITHRKFTVFCQRLELDRNQRMLCELLFSDYADAIEALAAEADAEADGVGRQTVIEAFSGRRLVDPQQLRELRIAVHEVYREYWEDVDARLDDLLGGVQSILPPEHPADIVAALRELRRTMLLHPRQASRMSFDYAGDGVDMLVLLGDALGEDGELHGLPDDALRDLRDNYSNQVDALLLDTVDTYRQVKMDLRLARIARDRDKLIDAERKAIELWRQLYDLNERTMRQVGEIAATHLGEHNRDQWEQRFREACFPWLYSSGIVDRQYRWVLEQTLSDEQRAGVEEAKTAFDARRRELREKAIDLMLAARMEMRSIVYPMMSRSDITSEVARQLHDQMLRNTGELAGAEAAATAAFESLLTDNQRAAMRRAMRR